MVPMIANNLIRLIWDAVPLGGDLLEWGSGVSTAWFAIRAHEKSVRFTSVEHDPEWYERVRHRVHAAFTEAGVATRHMDNVCRNLPTVSAEALVRCRQNNAHLEEEIVPGLEAYVFEPAVLKADVILVDGVARGACILQALNRCKPGARIFVHDACVKQHPWGRGWYAWAWMFHPRFRYAVQHEPDGSHPAPMVEIHTT